MFPQIQELHIIMTELDDRISEMTNSCSMVEEPNRKEVFGSALTYPTSLREESKEMFDYDFGG
jgi:hypothetical protein